MKKIYFMLLAMLAVGFTFTACSDEDPFSTATADDEPRIIAPTFPDRVNGALATVANINRDTNLEIELTVTPADYTTVVWLIDGEEVYIGTNLDISLQAGTYNLKVTASTEAGKSTYREGIVQVNPLPNDPWSPEVGLERIIVPGGKGRFYGDKLDLVESIIIEGKTISAVYVEDPEEGTYVEYDVPGDLSDGKHRVILVDTEGYMYGANTVNVTRNALITSGADRTKAGAVWTMGGLNLDQIASLTIAGQTITEFAQQSATEITITCPELADGEHTMVGKTKSGNSVEFYRKTINTEHTFVVSSKTVLWEGHHYVSWDLPEGDPNRVFNLIGQDVFAAMLPGATLSISYSVAPEAEYHKLETRTAHWTVLPGTDAVEFSEDGETEVQLTQEMLDLIMAQDGFICVGHGYYIDLVTVD